MPCYFNNAFRLFAVGHYTRILSHEDHFLGAELIGDISFLARQDDTAMTGADYFIAR